MANAQGRFEKLLMGREFRVLNSKFKDLCRTNRFRHYPNEPIAVLGVLVSGQGSSGCQDRCPYYLARDRFTFVEVLGVAPSVSDKEHYARGLVTGPGLYRFTIRKNPDRQCQNFYRALKRGLLSYVQPPVPGARGFVNNPGVFQSHFKDRCIASEKIAQPKSRHHHKREVRRIFENEYGSILEINNTVLDQYSGVSVARSRDFQLSYSPRAIVYGSGKAYCSRPDFFRLKKVLAPRGGERKND